MKNFKGLKHSLWRKLWFTAILQSFIFHVFTQISPENMKTALVYRIAQCVEWKTDTTTVFTIAILSDNEVLIDKFKELSKVAKLNKKPIKIKLISNQGIEQAAHIVYVDQSYNKFLPTTEKQKSNQHRLIITEEYNLPQDIMINIKFDALKSNYNFVYNRANILFAGLDLTDEIVLLKGTEVEIRQLYLEAKNLSDEQLKVVDELKKQSDVQTQNINLKNDSIQKMKGLIDLNQSKIAKQILVLTQKDSLSRDLNKKIVSQQVEIQRNILQAQQMFAERKTAENLLRSHQARINHQTALSDSLTRNIKLKQKDLIERNKTLSEKDTLIQRQNAWLIVSILIIIIVFASIILISRAYIITQRAKQKIAEQKKELEATLEQLRSMQQQLIQSEKMASLGVFIAGIAHEINNPINFISMGIDGIEKVIDKVMAMFTELNKLTDDSKGDEIQRLLDLKQKLKFQRSLDALPEIMENIKIGIVRTTAITNGLRLYARLDAEEKCLCAINQILDAALLLIKPQLNSEIKIELNYADLPQVKVFPGKLTQVFVNIFSNAIDSIRSKGKQSHIQYIHINTQLINDTISIEISDTGKGIPPEILPKIFDPFFTTKEVGKGTGLGMSIATSIVDELNGNISARNNSDGGATFKLEIPVI